LHTAEINTDHLTLNTNQSNKDIISSWWNKQW